MIKHVIFDLGQVLVKVDLNPFIYQFATEFNIDPILVNHSEHDGAHFDFQTGKINGTDFHRITCERFNHYVSLDRFRQIWASMLAGEVEGTSKIVDKLVEKNYTLSLLSNTDPWHYQYCETTMPVLQKFENIFLSYDLKIMKPDAEIFFAVVDALKTRAEQCLFIDDSAKNIESAKNLNFQTILFQNAKQLRSELEDLDILP